MKILFHVALVTVTFLLFFYSATIAMSIMFPLESAALNF
jgi:hypothetical protein